MFKKLAHGMKESSKYTMSSIHKLIVLSYMHFFLKFSATTQSQHLHPPALSCNSEPAEE